jgi:fructose-1,6-bisphosphatase/inositol monophosphatase family enzyme
MTSRDSLISWAPLGFTDALLSAASQAVEAQKRIKSETKSDGTLVTEADRASEAIIDAFISSHEPESFLIGEETVDKRDRDWLGRAMKGRTWVVDPIDGTALYSLGMFGWGVSVGLMENGIMKDGAVLFPDAGEDFSDAVSRNCMILFSDGAVVKQARMPLLRGFHPASAEVRTIETLEPIEDFAGMVAVSQTLTKFGTYAGPHTLLNTASCVYAFWQLMRGALGGYLVKVKLWDLAAVFPIAIRLGIKGCYADGAEIGPTVDAASWNTDPAKPQFLSMRDHGLFYRPGRCGPDFWKDLSWPGKPRTVK